MKRIIHASDLLPPDEYAKTRSELRRKLVERKKNRRVSVGPFATFYFECFDTMVAQVQEMLHIEKGGAAQIADELAAYNPLVPQGQELVATLMLEIDDPVRRARVLASLGGIEHQAMLRMGGNIIRGQEDQDRTNDQGKTSSVHFLHFPFSIDQIHAFKQMSEPVWIGFDHPEYGHFATLSPEVQKELMGDFSII